MTHPPKSPQRPQRRPLFARVARVAVRGLGKLPTPMKRALAGKPLVIDGQQLDVEAQVGMRLLNLTVTETFEKLPLDQGRAQIDGEAWVFGYEMPVAEVRDIKLPAAGGDIQARVYRPANVGAISPAFVYFHGGGWVLGDLGSGDSVSRYLANHAAVTVISVDYRLAPENKFPAGVDDALAAFTYLAEHADEFGIDPTRIAVGGESAGGNLAAVVSLDAAARARTTPGDPVPAFQMLFQPVTDLTTKHPSYDLFSDGFFLTSEQMDWYKNHYLADPQQAFDPRVSPLLAEDVSDVAPAYVVVSGFDVLRDEGEAYASKLRDAGVKVKLRRHEGLTHGLINATGVGTAARRALDEAARELRAGLNAPKANAGTPISGAAMAEEV